MEAHAQKRLAHFGRLCSLLGAAAQVLGASLGGLDPTKAAQASREMRTLLLEGADACDALARYCVDTAHLGPGYGEEDATMMALLFRMFRRIGDAVSEISASRLHDPTGVRFETWTEVSAHLRDAAIAASNHAEHLEGLRRVSVTPTHS